MSVDETDVNSQDDMGLSSSPTQSLPMREINANREVENASVHRKVEEQVHQEMAEDIPPELEAQLQTDPSCGLTHEQAQQRLSEYGRNGIPLFIFFLR